MVADLSVAPTTLRNKPNKLNKLNEPQKNTEFMADINPICKNIYEEIKAIANQLIPLFIKNRVEKAILFGSAARGKTTRKSDLDLMIVMKTDERFFNRYEQFDEIYEIIDFISLPDIPMDFRI